MVVINVQGKAHTVTGKTADLLALVAYTYVQRSDTASIESKKGTVLWGRDSGFVDEGCEDEIGQGWGAKRTESVGKVRYDHELNNHGYIVESILGL